MVPSRPNCRTGRGMPSGCARATAGWGRTGVGSASVALGGGYVHLSTAPPLRKERYVRFSWSAGVTTRVCIGAAQRVWARVSISFP